MSEPKRTFDEKLKAISGTVGIILGILALVPQFKETVEKAIKAFVELPSPVWFLTPAILLIAGVFALRDGLARRSRLLRPEALLLKADNPAHLKGRSEDIERLYMLCYEYQQVHLVGESGAGKSALIQAGLCPALTADKRLFPIYLNVWGQDWQEGPRTALIHVLWEALSEEHRGTLGLTALPEPETLAVILDQCRAKLGRIPLLIFDQFDDYQTRHRARFLSGRRGTWISADELIEATPFWGDVKRLIDDQVVRCLFTTRADTADGLESIRFVAPQVYRLPRLDANFILPLLTELTAHAEGAAPVVFAPDRGWERLKERLARDLNEDGAVLPVQMKIALQGLASLRAMTVRDYERAGGLHGLEAAHVERHIVNTALHSGLTKLQVQTLLTSLADAKTLKTVPRSTDDMAIAITAGDESHAGRIRKAMEEALDDLEKKEIIRKRLDPDTHQHVWILDHDYLCRGVLEAKRRANHWFALAQEGYRAFQDAGSSTWRKWRSLLSPWQQMVLLTERVRGRFHYGTLRSYAAWSLFRFVPYLMILAAVSFGWFENLQRRQAELARTKASQILSDIGLSESTLLPTEVDHFWDLATSNNTVRFSFLNQILESSGAAERFNRRADIAIQAIIGLDSDKRNEIRKTVELHCFQSSPQHFTIKMACARIGIALLMDDDQSFKSFAFNTLREAIEGTTDLWQLAAQAEVLKVMAEKLVPAEAQQLVDQLIAAIKQTTDPWQLDESLASALKMVTEKLAPTEAQQSFNQLIAAIKQTTDSRQLAALAGTLKVVAERLPPAEAQQSFDQLIAAIEQTPDPWQLAALVGALEAVPGTLASGKAQQLVDQLIAAIKQTTNPWQLESLARALKTVAE